MLITMYINPPVSQSRDFTRYPIVEKAVKNFYPIPLKAGGGPAFKRFPVKVKGETHDETKGDIKKQSTGKGTVTFKIDLFAAGEVSPPPHDFTKV